LRSTATALYRPPQIRNMFYKVTFRRLRKIMRITLGPLPVGLTRDQIKTHIVRMFNPDKPNEITIIDVTLDQDDYLEDAEAQDE